MILTTWNVLACAIAAHGLKSRMAGCRQITPAVKLFVASATKNYSLNTRKNKMKQQDTNAQDREAVIVKSEQGQTLPELLPCPTCGHQPKVQHFMMGEVIACVNKLCGSEDYSYYNHEDAVNAWNRTRSDDAKLAERLQEAETVIAKFIADGFLSTALEYCKKYPEPFKINGGNNEN